MPIIQYDEVWQTLVPVPRRKRLRPGLPVDADMRTRRFVETVRWLSQFAGRTRKTYTSDFRLSDLPPMKARFRSFGYGIIVVELSDQKGPASVSILSDGVSGGFHVNGSLAVSQMIAHDQAFDVAEARVLKLAGPAGAIRVASTKRPEFPAAIHFILRPKKEFKWFEFACDLIGQGFLCRPPRLRRRSF